MTSTWVVASATGTAEHLHAFVPGEVTLDCVVRRAEVTHPAVVLGSTQRGLHLPDVGTSRDGIEVVRRRTGGGAVLVEPDGQLWFDVRYGPTNSAVVDDVAATAWKLGEVIGAALTSCGVTDVHVHRGGLTSTRWSSDICFAGLGPGEVTVDGSKLVGVAQRRSRSGVLLHVLVPRVWRPELLCSVVGRPEALDDVSECAVGLSDVGVDADVLFRDVVERLSRA